MAYVEKIASARIRSVTVAIHKPSLESRETFQARNRLYFYTCRFLLERVSWFCRDHYKLGAHSGDGSIDLIFSKRKNLSYVELKEYLEKLHKQSGSQDIRINWEQIKSNQIKAFSASQKMGLQVADAIASSTFSALNRNDYGYTEDRYITTLSRGMYRHAGNLIGYGMKIWPFNEAEAIKEGNFRWLIEANRK